MAKAWFLLLGMWIGVGCGVVAEAQLPTASAPVQAAPTAKKRCKINAAAPNPAETSLNKKEYSSAESLFREMLAKDANDEVAHEGLVRALVEQDKVDAAAKDAETWVASAPASSMALVALGGVRLRQGAPREAFVQFQKATQADPCNARAYLGVSEVDGLAGMHAESKRMIEQAYALHPGDDDIHTAWIWTRQRKERLGKLAEYAEHSDQINVEDKTKLKTSLEKQSLYHTSDCRAAPTSPREATVPMVAVMDGPDRFLGWGLDVKFNGTRRYLEIDTGASGITISREAAMSLGITREEGWGATGIGDNGKVKTSVIHVASIRIGGMEFLNCPVEILEKWRVLNSDGLIGGDVFDESVLTLDFPKHELRVAPLPLRPGEKEADRIKLDTAGDDVVVEAHDPYVAPEMAKWERIYRTGHELLMPTGIIETKRMKDTSAWKHKLFMLDTGAELNLISPAAAKEVTKVSRDWDSGIRGISGTVDKVFEARKFSLEFAGLLLDSPTMTAIDLTSISHNAGVEVSGLIGAPALFQVVMHIDYRDNLVWCEYTAKN